MKEACNQSFCEDTCFHWRYIKGNEQVPLWGILLPVLIMTIQAEIGPELTYQYHQRNGRPYFSFFFFNFQLKKKKRRSLTLVEIHTC